MTSVSPPFVGKAPTIPAQIAATKRPKSQFPDSACDVHVHIFGPQDRYPHGPNPGYIPNPASVEELRAMLGIIGCKRAVIVQPSYYGTDNRCTVDALRAGNGDFRGIAHFTPETSDTELDALHAAGVRGVRLNLKAIDGKVAYAALDRLAERIAGRGWHIQLYFYADHMPALDEHLARLPVEVSIDHFGYVRAADGVKGAGFQMLLRLARGNRAWFKLSAPYRQSVQAPLFEDVGPLARALYEIAPSRCIWGSDWPHASRNDTGILQVPNDGDLADAFIGWFPDAAERKRILVDNPARLYDFA